MKRRISSDQSFGSAFKRRSSSLFSIATIDEDAASSPFASARPSEQSLPGKSRHLRSVTLSSPYSSETEGSSDSTDGFFIEDEEEFVKNDVLLQTKTNFFFSGTTLIEPSEATEAVEPIKPVQEETGDLQTGLVFEAGAQHYDRHNRFHKERPLRVTSVMEHLTQSKLQDRCQFLSNESSESSPEKVFLEDEDYLRVHLPGYMQRLDKLSNCTCCDRLDREAEQFKSIYFTPDSVKEAKKAATSLCRLVSQVIRGDLDNGFALIRPPGHHAEPGLAGGYCVINNVAVAAAYAREKMGVRKVLIVDWDVHHGNGTQNIFINDPDVLYFSVHRENFFPFLPNSGASNVGLNKGAGYNVNVGWSRKGMGDDEYLAVWETILMPIAREYQPDLVMVSAGFDAALGDMGDCHVTPECFGRLTRSLMTLADGKVVCALEGGYVRSVLGKCVESVISNLLDRKSCEISEKEAKQDQSDRDGDDILSSIDATAAKNIRSTMAAHQPFWTCFQTQE